MARARHEYTLHFTGDEKYPISGTSWTNDDDDDGYIDPKDASWPERYKSKEQMLRETGGTHIGNSGILVLVYLDGELIDTNGKPLSKRERAQYENDYQNIEDY